ncbi:hypothetical protein [Streptomyces sp. NPDC048603]|uniref:hypothetical protein n=1 Tax=Streptomyces sp. NPDC048603 TaxID=3365577 RepID=UPI0037189D12
MKRLLATAVSAAAALVLAAGGAASAQPTDDAGKQLCTDLGELKADNAKLKALDPATATKDQIKQAHDDVQDEAKEVAESKAQFDQARKDAVQKAATDLQTAFAALPGDTTGKQALDKLQPQIQSLDSAVDAATTSLDCDGGY